MLSPEQQTPFSTPINSLNKPNTQQFKTKLTSSNIILGTLRIKGENLKLFPINKKSRKIEGLFENEDSSILLTYSPKHGLLYGLTGWYKEHSAQSGDVVKITLLEPKKKFKFFFEQTPRQESPESFHMKSPLKNSKRSLVGEPINFRGIIYGPINEQGVVFLFSKIHHDLGIKIEGIQQGFPDARARRFNGRAWVSERIEFEFRSSEFIRHGHDADKCDIIVCWTHDWKDCPLEVIELKSIINQLPQ